MTGLVFDIQRYSLHDGPGIRTTVFLKGCPLRCRWCHNPESLEGEPEVALTPALCVGCARCVEVCPQHGHAFAENGVHTIDRERCTRCGKCAEECPAGALELVGKRMAAGDVLDEVLRDKIFYDESDGGMTVSGGELLAQPEFSLELLAAGKRAGLHTAIETTGFGRWEDLAPIVEQTDLVLYDFKHADAQRHKELTGVDNRLILENLRRVVATGKPVVVRMPVIPGQNDDEANFHAMGRRLADLEPRPKVHLLKYNVLAPGKYERVGKTYPLADCPPEEPSAEALAGARAILTSYGLEVSTD